MWWCGRCEVSLVEACPVARGRRHRLADLSQAPDCSSPPTGRHAVLVNNAGRGQVSLHGSCTGSGMQLRNVFGRMAGLLVATCLTFTPTSRAADTQQVTLGSDDLTAGIPGEGPLTLDQIEAWLADRSQPCRPGSRAPARARGRQRPDRGPRQEPADAGEDRTRPAAVLRPAAVRRRLDQLRLVPPSRTGLRSQHAVRRRHRRADRRPQLAGQLQPHPERPAILGRPRRLAGRAGGGTDRQPDRDGEHARRLRRRPAKRSGLQVASSRRSSARTR